MSFHPHMLNFRQVIRAIVFALLLSLFAAAHVPIAAARTFALSASAFSPPAGVDPGGTATATITLSTPDSYTGSVALTCVVTSNQGASTLPSCLISPSAATPYATPSLTVTTVGVSAGSYTVTVTGTGTGGSPTASVTLYLNVVDVPQDYTLTVSTAISPGTVTAGDGAQATVTVTPIASYIGKVTLSCLSVTPITTAAPFCAFNPPTVDVNNGTAPTAVLTVSTYGTLQNQAKISMPRVFYALWLAVPGLGLVGIGVSEGSRKKLLGLLLLVGVVVGLLILPSCNSTNTLSNSNNSNGLVTPNNTYTITLTGVDENGVSPSNTTTSTSQATVSLTVN